MARPTKLGVRASPFDSVDLDLGAVERGEVHRSALDPALLAAKLLLARAIKTAGITGEQAGADGTVSVAIVPESEWTELACLAWREMMRGGERWEEGERGRAISMQSWTAWLSDAALRPIAVREANDLVAKAVSAGRHCVGFSPDEAWLPPDLVYSADLRIVLPVLTGADLRQIAAALCGVEPTACLPEEDAAALTPRLLRLARRPGQRPDAYIAKLAELLTRDRARASSKSTTGSPRDDPTLDRLHGMDEAVVWGLGLARDLAEFQAGTLDWAGVDKGVLLSGPPGCGKTLFARALAATCGVPLVTGSYGRWHGTGLGHQGDLLKAMATTFADARRKAPCILFLDEIDSFPDRSAVRHRYAEWHIQIVNALLAEIDGVEGREGVVLVGACNHPDKLDPALIRSGRLDRHIRVRLPDCAALERILREHLGSDVGGIPVVKAALAAAGSSGADCERLIRGARRRARANGRAVTIDDIMAEIGGDDSRSQQSLWVAAVHEAGHAIASCVLRPGCLDAVTLRGDGEQGGSTSSRWSDGPVRLKDIRDHLVFVLAGRAAEEVVFGEPSTGSGGSAASDLAVATRLALQAAACLGFDADEGLVWSGQPDIADMSEILTSNPELRSRVRQTLGHAYADALALAKRHIDAVHSVATALVDHRALSGDAVVALVTQHSVLM